MPVPHCCEAHSIISYNPIQIKTGTISAFTEDVIEKQGISNLVDIGKCVPNLNVTDERYDNARLNANDYVLRILSNDIREYGLRFARKF